MKLHVPVMTAGLHPYSGIQITENAILCSLHKWTSEFMVGGSTCYGTISPSPSVPSNAAASIRTSNITHYTDSMWYDRHNQTLMASLTLMGSVFSTIDSYRLVHTAAKNNWLWRVPVVAVRVDAKGTTEEILITRIDVYIGTSVFVYPWVHASAHGAQHRFESYDEAMKVVG